MPICPFIYINGHAQQRACQSKKHGACFAFLLSHPHPKISATNPLFFSIFQQQIPYFCPYFTAKTPIPRTKNTQIRAFLWVLRPLLQMVGTFQCVMQARCLSDPSSGSPSGLQYRTLQAYKNRPHNYFSTAKMSRTPFDSSKYGCFCNKYGHVFPIFKAYINRHVKGCKYLIVSNLFLLYWKSFVYL